MKNCKCGVLNGLNIRKHMKNKNLSRRKFIQNSSLAALGSTFGLTFINGCKFNTSKNKKSMTEIDHYNPKKDGGCAVALALGTAFSGRTVSSV